MNTNLSKMTEKGVVLCVIMVVPVMSVFGTNLQCPQECMCTFMFTDCKSNNLDDLPSGIDPNVTILDLSYNKFQQFPDRLNVYGELLSLNLSHNEIQSLGVSALRNLKKLQKLDLTYNKFVDWLDIRSFVFLPASSLKFLDLSHNFLRSLSRDKNPLRSSSLQILKLKNCSINYVDNTIFEKQPNLQELHISDNPIKKLNASFSSSSLKFLDLSRCNLQNITSTAFTNLTGLETVQMYQNINLKKFSCDSSSLLYLDLSDCNLETIPTGYLPKVYIADFNGNHFRIIPSNSFKHFTSLKFLDLSYNAISLIEKDAFNGLTKLERIDLSLNTLSTVRNDAFLKNTNLEYLNLSRNYFSTIEMLQNPSLKVLDLSSCEIRTFRSDCLITMPNLQQLSLSKNVISLLPDYFEGENLLELDVSLCRIKNVNNRTFTLMSSLRNLNLAGNRLTTASPGNFQQVVFLDISDNPWRCDCTQLKELYVWLTKTGKPVDNLYCQSPEMVEGHSWFSACEPEWHPGLARGDTLWWYTTGLIAVVFLVLFMILVMRRMYLLKEKRLRQLNESRRIEERESLRRMRHMQLEAREEASRNAPDPRELQTPPSYNEALLLPRLDASHPSLSGSLHSLASKHSIHGSLQDVSKRGRPRRKRRRRSDSSEGQRASRVVVDSDSSDPDPPQPRATLESDF